MKSARRNDPALLWRTFGLQVGALVMGAGGYRFRDYLRVGVPLILITLVIAVVVPPLLWPF